MAKQRVYELARDLGVDSKEVLARAQERGIAVKTASSGLAEDDVAMVRLSYEEETAPAAEAEPQPAPAEPDEQPVEEAALPVEEPTAAEEPADDDDAPPAPGSRGTLEVERGITVMEFADEISRGVGTVVKSLLEMGEMVSAQGPVPPDALELLGEQFGYTVVVHEPEALAEVAPAAIPRLVFDDDEADLAPRPAVVTVMGHVDHGKTQLLDTIRKANVVAGEAGGITQHIGAYQAVAGGNLLTFIDTPGHEAFTALRARGANVTDIVILVVAADDGVMPQTIEAINHAKAAGVPMVIAINKTDLATANPVAVRAQLTEQGILTEELGGDIVSNEVSALTGDGVDELLESVQLVAELEEFKANPDAPAAGTVIESQLDKGRGPVATVVVQRGTLRVGDSLVAGAVSGRVRAMFDENGAAMKEAVPSTPALVMGWSDVPSAGDFFYVAADEKEARSMASDRLNELRAERLVVPTAQERLTLLLEQLRSADQSELRIVVKADAHGSLEAIRDAVAKIQREDAGVTVIHAAVGGINENDVVLAEASDGIVFGFNVRPDGPARRAAEQRAIEIRTYRIIYELLEDVESMLVGQLAPEEKEVLLGTAEVRATFRAPRFGLVAGCMVTEGRIGSLRRFKDDVPNVAAGFECGIGLENFRDIKDGDVLESYEIREVART
jgi:translation initiation factor IF-2